MRHDTPVDEFVTPFDGLLPVEELLDSHAIGLEHVVDDSSLGALFM
jgi:hypothetical protein